LSNDTTHQNDEDDDDQSTILFNAMLKGGTLSEKEISELENEVKTQPDSLLNRIRILGYFASKGIGEDPARIAHILWIIKNHSDLSELIVPLLDVPESGRAAYETVRAAWEEQLQNNSDSVKVILNAAMFFRSAEEKRELALLRQAQALAPDDLKLQRKLANHYMRANPEEDVEQFKSNCIVALRLFEHILSQSKDDIDRFYRLTDVATAALRVGEFTRAEEIAREMLTVAPQFASDWNYGNAIYWANIVLGKIALSDKRLGQACEYLVAASLTPGSPQLDSFGPEFVLCSHLLNAGETECAKTYLSNCAKFWREVNKLSGWIIDIDKGLQPSFYPSRMNRSP
jgi:tetratricopeptide (TPR) repeat protein